MDYLELYQATIIGHSMGGQIATISSLITQKGYRNLY
ncbi:hypothetical protein ACQKM1_20925 [Peribacillus frigoritolerans]